MSDPPTLETTAQTLLDRWKPHFGELRGVLYHYTSAEGLAGIIGSRSLWMTDIRYLNDLSELQYAQALLGARIEERLALGDLNTAQTEFLRRCVRGLDSAGLGQAYYSTSFCEDGNLLSQWRAYRGSGGGYAIGFDFVHTLRLLDRPCVLRRMIYDPELQASLVDDAIAAFVYQVGLRLPDDMPDDDEFVPKACRAFRSSTAEIMFSFKHPGFREEREWRLLHIASADPRYDRGGGTPRLRTYDGNMIPYQEASFAGAIQASLDDTAGIRFPIVDVVIGPTVNAELNRQSIKGALLGLAPDVEHVVSDSGIPLRWL